MTSNRSSVDAIAITKDSKKLVSGSFGQRVSRNRAISTLKLWNLQTGKLVHEFSDNFSSVKSLANAIVDLLEETLASEGSKFIAARNINSAVTK